MPQVLISPGDIKGNALVIRGPEAHHLVRVLRVKAGDFLSLFDGAGGRYKARCESVDPAIPLVHAFLLEKAVSSNRPYDVTLFQGLPKGSKIDYVIEKATELGAEGVVPFLSEKNIIKLTLAQSAAKQKRWINVVKAAAKQSGRAALPTIEAARPLREFESRFKAGLTLFLDTRERRTTLKMLRERLATGRSAESKLINIVVGPESGFSEAERMWLVGCGALPVSLGSRTLRAETAGLVALAIINHELGI